jgi:hypothetical protein
MRHLNTQPEPESDQAEPSDEASQDTSESDESAA